MSLKSGHSRHQGGLGNPGTHGLSGPLACTLRSHHPREVCACAREAETEGGCALGLMKLSPVTCIAFQKLIRLSAFGNESAHGCGEAQRPAGRACLSSESRCFPRRPPPLLRRAVDQSLRRGRVLVCPSRRCADSFLKTPLLQPLSTRARPRGRAEAGERPAPTPGPGRAPQAGGRVDRVARRMWPWRPKACVGSLSVGDRCMPCSKSLTCPGLSSRLSIPPAQGAVRVK